MNSTKNRDRSRNPRPKHVTPTTTLKEVNCGPILDEIEAIFRRAVAEPWDLNTEARAAQLLNELSAWNVDQELIKAFHTAIEWFRIGMARHSRKHVHKHLAQYVAEWKGAASNR